MSSSAASNKRVFREYIGAQDKNVNFNDVEINPGVEFHYILAFALDYDKTTLEPINGVFTEFWDTINLTPDAVAAVKKKHPNVRVMLSVGGATVGGSDRHATFAPTGVSSWVENAFNTLTSLIDKYGLDGVDINYESFAQQDTHMFVECIKNLLTRLKESNSRLITSIAPYSDTQCYYEALWNGNCHLIDYVNFQFYAYGSDTQVENYINYYDVQAGTYGQQKLLAAINTSDPRVVNIINRDVALAACRALKNACKLKAGIFIWSADSSKANRLDNEYETMAQEMLAN